MGCGQFHSGVNGLKKSQTKVLCVTTVLKRKDLIALQTIDTALPGEQCVAFQKERKPKPGNQRQSRSTKKPFVLKVDEDGEEHFYEVVDKICTLNQQ